MKKTEFKLMEEANFAAYERNDAAAKYTKAESATNAAFFHYARARENGSADHKQLDYLKMAYLESKTREVNALLEYIKALNNHMNKTNEHRKSKLNSF